ncbi:MAG: alpha/beta hydrolase [Acidimicrobiales bacterium]
MTAPVMAGAEPFSAAGGSAGVLVLHGFTGNPQSMRGIAERLADAGLTVELPLLPGHGTAIEDLVPLRWPDWAGAAEAAYADLAARCSRVAVVGLSMGGTLSCALAERHDEIPGLVLVNPLVEPPDEQFRSAVRDLLASGTEIAPGIGSDIARPDARETTYDGAPLAAALSLFEGTTEVASGLAAIGCPVLLFSSRQDHVVAPSSGDLLAATVTGPVERVWLERSYHVATLDYDQDEIEERTVAFVTAVTGG